MPTIRCSISGCSTQFDTTEPVAANARFICKNHKRAEQLKAIGRKYSSKADEKDREVRFQDHQFDRDLSRATGAAEGAK